MNLYGGEIPSWVWVAVIVIASIWCFVYLKKLIERNQRNSTNKNSGNNNGIIGDGNTINFNYINSENNKLAKNKEYPDYVMNLVLEIHSNTNDMPNRKDVYKIIDKVYKAFGYKVSMTLYDSITGRIEIKDGYHKEVLSPLIKQLIKDLKLKSVVIINPKNGIL